MPGPFTIPPAALAAAVAQNSGLASGRTEAYKDQVAQAADLKRLQEQQRQFDAEQKRMQDEFQANNALATRRDTREQSAFDTERGNVEKIRAFRATLVDPAAPVSVDPRIPGGATKPPTAEQQLATLHRQLAGAMALGDTQTAHDLNSRIADLEGAPLRAAQIQGLQLDNAAHRYQNSIAPTIAQVDIAMKRAQIHAVQNDTPQLRASLEAGLVQLRDSLARQTYKYELDLNQRYTTNPLTLGKDLQGVATGMQAAAKVLQTETGAGALRTKPIDTPIQGLMVPVPGGAQRQGTLGDALAAATQDIQSSVNPLTELNTILTSASAQAQAVRGNPEAMAYLSGVAMQRNLIMRMQGQTPGAAPPAATKRDSGIAGLSLKPSKPKGPFQPPAPVGPFGF